MIYGAKCHAGCFNARKKIHKLEILQFLRHRNTYHIAIAQIDGRILVSIETIRVLFGQFVEIVHQRRSIFVSCDEHKTIVEQFFRFVKFYIESSIAAITAIPLTLIYRKENVMNSFDIAFNFSLLCINPSPDSSFICKLTKLLSVDR